LAKLDCFEDANECYLWRWELSSIDLLPSKEAAKVKKARGIRKKLQSHHAAIFKLISSIDNATKWLEKNSLSSSSTPVLAKVSDMEEKVLKFEREEEKARLIKEAKTQKAKVMAEELAAKQAAKQQEKERLEQERLNAKKLKEEEKAAAAKEREEAKRKKEEEKLQQQREAEEKESKRKARFTSFFSAPKKKQKTSPTKQTQVDSDAAPSFDGDAFRSLINSKESHSLPFATRKQQKTQKIKVSVHITVLSDNPFAPQPYDEEKVISVPNKYKFLGFHEDHRPPYHGTWSKSSSLVTGRRPLGKDTEFLNYEVDSEAEWEEEDEDGEDCDKSEGGEEEDIPDDDDNDSFLAAEDELGLDEDDDEETKNLRKKKLLSEATISVKACVIAPRTGGLCHIRTEAAMESVIEGFGPKDAVEFLASHTCRVLTPDALICLDALPPKVRDEQEPKPPATQKMSTEAMRLMAQFVHNSTVNSKEKIVTELLIAHPSVASSRAQAMRELEVTAEKRRLPKGAGVVWEVKADHLNVLGLTDKDLVRPFFGFVSS
jgi:hypothetical protein